MVIWWDSSVFAYPLPRINLSFLWSLTSLVQSEITQSKVKARAGGGVGSGYRGWGSEEGAYRVGRLS